MLLESHPAIGPAIAEDCRIDREFRPNYVLAGYGRGSINDHMRRHEPMLLEFLRDFLQGNQDEQRFLDAMDYWKTISCEARHPRNNYQFYLHDRMCAFRKLGIVLEPKSNQFLLYRGHCHKEHLSYDLTRMTDQFYVVSSIRHPLLSVITILRRQDPSQWQSDFIDWLSAVRCIFSLKNAFIFCADLWQATPKKMESLFSYLGLQTSPATDAYISAHPIINKTREPADRTGDVDCCMNHENPAAFHAMLNDAKRLLAENQLHPFLMPYWDEIKNSDVLPHFEKSGYRFDL
jgi:hypothetical protein